MQPLAIMLLMPLKINWLQDKPEVSAGSVAADPAGTFCTEPQDSNPLVRLSG
jgi:hypothetical protein